ncbi:RbsD/FucU family protein [Methylobrevis albus]|uniref:Transporter n=1 Tax=Methylobrevis albus TaxID=2793297 RepID=A0A931I145_9HYPH|nr:RbsD/FucU domain-containing protein [Methylobrevis albus]MBH0237449.1 transporter [Methylobrevis albus]
MLKGIDPILGPELLAALRAMGHGDEIAIVDANYPAVTDARRLIRMDGHDAVTLLDAVLSLLPLDDFVPAAAFRPAAGGDPDRAEPIFAEFATTIARREPGFAPVPLVGLAFYDRVRAAFAVVASGERRLYGNIILRKGVIRP